MKDDAFHGEHRSKVQGGRSSHALSIQNDILRGDSILVLQNAHNTFCVRVNCLLGGRRLTLTKTRVIIHKDIAAQPQTEGVEKVAQVTQIDSAAMTEQNGCSRVDNIRLEGFNHQTGDVVLTLGRHKEGIKLARMSVAVHIIVALI